MLAQFLLQQLLLFKSLELACILRENMLATITQNILKSNFHKELRDSFLKLYTLFITWRRYLHLVFLVCHIVVLYHITDLYFCNSIQLIF